MKKLLIASSVMAALSMGAAHAAPVSTPHTLTENGGTIEFIGEITDTTCWAGLDGNFMYDSGKGSKLSGDSVVVLPVIPMSNLPAVNSTAGRTKFAITVRADITSGGTNECTLGTIADRDEDSDMPTGTSHQVSKVKAIFGGNLTAADDDIYHNAGSPYNTGNQGNVDNATGYLNNIASIATANGLRDIHASATGVKLRLLNSDYSIIKVGDAASQMSDTNTTPITGSGTGNNTKSDLTSGIQAVLPYYVEYIRTDSAFTAGMVRSFVVYDLYYQ